MSSTTEVSSENHHSVKRKGTLRTCPKGHQYYKSSDCPVCPVCEAERKPAEGFLALLTAPARRALEGAGITSLKKLSTYTEAEDRKSTRLNSSHVKISYAVFCLK